MRQAAADRAAIADLRMADKWQRLGQQRIAFFDQVGALGCALADHRAELETAVPGVDLLDVTQTVDVDQVRGSRQSQTEQWHQALPASKDFGIAAVLGK